MVISLENRFQTAQRVFSSLLDSRSPQEILSALFYFNAQEQENLFAFFVSERLAKSNLLLDNTLLLLCQNCVSVGMFSSYSIKYT